MVAGDHVPVMPLGEVVASDGATAAWQKDCVVGKSGTTGVVTSTCNVCGTAHWPALGVKT